MNACSNITIIEKTDIIKENLLWQEWRDIILAEYNGRLAAIGAKGFGTITDKKAFTAMFLRIKGFPVSVTDILQESIRIIKGQAASPSLKEYDAIAMLGHRIGMLENSTGIKQYLQDIELSLRPDGGLLFTSIAINQNPVSPNSPTTVFHNLQIQQVYLIGPFFALLRVKAEALQKQGVAANWQCEFIYRHDENNYAARLSPFQSG